MTAMIIPLLRPDKRRGPDLPSPRQIRNLLFVTPMPTTAADFIFVEGCLTPTEMISWWHFRFALWIYGPVPNEDTALARAAHVTKRRWAKAKPRFAPFFDRADDGAWTDLVIMAERERVVAQAEGMSR